jgi:hypothetical protein
MLSGKALSGRQKKSGEPGKERNRPAADAISYCRSDICMLRSKNRAGKSSVVNSQKNTVSFNAFYRGKKRSGEPGKERNRPAADAISYCRSDICMLRSKDRAGKYSVVNSKKTLSFNAFYRGQKKERRAGKGEKPARRRCNLLLPLRHIYAKMQKSRGQISRREFQEKLSCIAFSFNENGTC